MDIFLFFYLPKHFLFAFLYQSSIFLRRFSSAISIRYSSCVIFFFICIIKNRAKMLVSFFSFFHYALVFSRRSKSAWTGVALSTIFFVIIQWVLLSEAALWRRVGWRLVKKWYYSSSMSWTLSSEVEKSYKVDESIVFTSK